LIGTVARTAVIAGTATAVSGAVAGSAQQKAQQQAAAQNAMAQQQAAEQQAQIDASVQEALASQAPTPQLQAPASNPGSQTDDTIAQLQKLGELYKSGILTDEEFAAMKAKLLQ
jgi:hypothetical protein